MSGARRLVPALALLLCAGGCAPAVPAGSPGPDPGLPRTRAERSGYTETSTYADVVGFVDSLSALGAPIVPGLMGTTSQGRQIPVVIASRPRVSSPEEARALDRPIVYVQANIHGGEVEGKEALLALLRDLALEPRANALDSLVLVAVPVYNVDGNEAFGPQAENRPEQRGPERVGRRANGQGLDLNRDYVKAEAPETRASLRMFELWDPDVFVDLHATDGSYHGYALTYAPSLSPAAGAAGRFTRERILPELRRRMRERRGYETFDYGNFSLRYGADFTADAEIEGWYTYDSRPRFGTNYYGIRGGIAVLSEAFSHDPFERRVASTYAFVDELLSLVAESAGAVLAVARAEEGTAGREIPLRSEPTRSPYVGEVVAEVLESDPDSVPDEPGVHPGIRRTGRYRTLRIPVYDRFDVALERVAPAAYLLDPAQTAAVELLERHGVRVDRLSVESRLPAEAFVLDSVVHAPRPFQGHREVRVEGRWRTVERVAPPGSFLVSTAQPLGALAVFLLEPESEDGLTTWNVFDPFLRPGEEHPVLRLGR